MILHVFAEHVMPLLAPHPADSHTTMQFCHSVIPFDDIRLLSCTTIRETTFGLVRCLFPCWPIPLDLYVCFHCYVCGFKCHIAPLSCTEIQKTRFRLVCCVFPWWPIPLDLYACFHYYVASNAMLHLFHGQRYKKQHLDWCVA